MQVGDIEELVNPGYPVYFNYACSSSEKTPSSLVVMKCGREWLEVSGSIPSSLCYPLTWFPGRGERAWFQPFAHETGPGSEAGSQASPTFSFEHLQYK